MISVQTVVPAQFRAMGIRAMSYNAREVDSFSSKEVAKGTPAQRFAQYKIMGQIQAAVIALRALNGNGNVTVIVRNGHSDVVAELNQPNDETRILASEALREVVDLASRLAKYRNTEFEFRWAIKTTYSNVRIA